MTPRDSWVVSGMANSSNGRPSSHSLLDSTQYLRSIDFSIWWNLFSAPWLSGWYTLEIWCFTNNSDIICAKTLDIKIDPWSVWIRFGNPKVEKNLIKAFTSVLALNVHNEAASGTHLAAHIMVTRYWWPAIVLGKGPTQSIMKCSNSSPSTGIRCVGARGITWFGFPVT